MKCLPMGVKLTFDALAFVRTAGEAGNLASFPMTIGRTVKSTKNACDHFILSLHWRNCALGEEDKMISGVTE
jgi:hypothetical protein